MLLLFKQFELYNSVNSVGSVERGATSISDVIFPSEIIPN